MNNIWKQFHGNNLHRKKNYMTFIYLQLVIFQERERKKRMIVIFKNTGIHGLSTFVYQSSLASHPIYTCNAKGSFLVAPMNCSCNGSWKCHQHHGFFFLKNYYCFHRIRSFTCLGYLIVALLEH